MAPTATTTIPFAFAEAVDEFRRLRGKTQAELAALSGIPTTTLQRRLAAGDFNTTELGPIATALDVNVRTIFDRACDIAGIADEGSST